MIPGLKAIPTLQGAGSSGGGVGGNLSLTFVGFSTSMGANGPIVIPAAAIAGDYAILFDTAENLSGSSIAAVVPLGWTSIANDFAVGGGRSLRMMVSHRILAAPGGGSITGMNDSAETKLLLVFRPSSSISSIIPSAWNTQITSGNPSSQTVTASGVATPLIVFAWASVGHPGETLPAFTTETPAMTNLTSGDSPTQLGPETRLGYTMYNTSPANQSIDVGDGGDVTGLQSGYVRFT